MLTADSRIARNTLRSLVLGAFAFSLVLNVLLARRAGAQRAQMDEIRSQYTPLLRQTVPGFVATSLDGNAVTIDFADSPVPTVLYTFAPDCSWCSRNKVAFDALVAAAGLRYRFVAVSLAREGLGDHLGQHPYSVDVLTDLEPTTIKAFQLGGTPQTIVVDANGTVLANWHGAYIDDQANEVETFFAVSLPDIPLSEEAHR